MTIKKIDESGFKDIGIIFFEDDTVYLIPQFLSPLTNFDAKNREDQILDFFISPQLPFVNLSLWPKQLPFQKLSKGFVFILLFQIKIFSSLLSVFFYVLI
jgi:hypothetical protein